MHVVQIFRTSFECILSCQGQWFPETIWWLYVELLLISSTGQNCDISLINGNKGYFEKGCTALELSLTTKNLNERYFILL